MVRRTFGWLLAVVLLLGGAAPMTAGAGETAQAGTTLVKAGKHGKKHGKRHGKKHGKKKHGKKHAKKTRAAV